MQILVINSGSSSVKFRVYDMQRESLLLSGAVTRIGEDSGSGAYRRYADSGVEEEEQVIETPAGTHAEALQQILSGLENSVSGSLSAIGHRVVHGGDRFRAPTRIDDKVIKGLRDMIPLAPLHNPASLAGIEATHKLCPQLPQVAVFDTAFFRSLPACAARYAVPDEWYRQYHVRRYGFHGISHQHVAGEAAAWLGCPLTSLRLITLHLGNGASVAAIRDGICVDTSMGMTPLAGLIMGTRCGDLDPAIHFYLARTLGMSLDEIEDKLNSESGMKGLCGVSDMREVLRLAHQGDEMARLAIDMYCYRISKYIGAYHAVLGGIDALVFTGGVGENAPFIRRAVCTRLSATGVTLDDERNQGYTGGISGIGASSSQASVLVVPANEELEIARQAVAVIRNR